MFNFAYFELPVAVLQAVAGVTAAIKTKPVTGAALNAAVAPVFAALTAVNPKIKVPSDLVGKIAEAAAEAINDYIK